MIVRFSPRAIQDLTDIADFIRSQNPSASQRVRTAILDGIELISRFPNAGRRQSVENVRKLIIRRYPYLVYYMVDAAADELVVISVRHTAREREYSDV
jgi:addiction module RelE/StbE family toxin